MGIESGSPEGGSGAGVRANHWSERLPWDACSEALSWALAQPSAEDAWAACIRGDWMLWLLGRVSGDRKLLVSIACVCARTSLKYVPTGDDIPLRCIEITESWCRGESTIENVKE